MQKDYFPFVYCVESLVYNHNYTYWETCYEKLGLDATPVTKCIKGDQGKEVSSRGFLFQFPIGHVVAVSYDICASFDLPLCIGAVCFQMYKFIISML